jgi:DNA repair protein RecO (recombination protein O)
MLVHTEAIVLHSLKYGDSRIIVDMFTRRAGRLSFIVTVPKTQKGKMKKQFFQPMMLLEVECDIRQNAQLQRLKDVRLLLPYHSIPFSPEKLALSLFTAEFLYHALRAELQNEPLFAYIADAMQWLDLTPSGYANFHLTFLMRMSRFLGFYPNLDNYSEDCLFDLRAATFVRDVPLHTDYLSAQDARRIHQLMRMDFPTMHLYRMTRQERNRIIEVLLQYYQLHIPQFPEMKSISVLQELWA